MRTEDAYLNAQQMIALTDDDGVCVIEAEALRTLLGALEIAQRA